MHKTNFNLEDILNRELVLLSRSPKDTEKIAKEFAKLVKKGDNIFLMGDLGAGKTFFTNCLVKELGINEFANSPSFKLINEYNAKDSKNFKVCHFDLYRLESIYEILELGWDEYLSSEDICIVEWAEKAKEVWPQQRFEISFEYHFELDFQNKDFNQRMIKIKKL